MDTSSLAHPTTTMVKESQPPCPSCGSRKTRRISKWDIFGIGAFFLLMGVSFSAFFAILILTLPLVPVTLLVAVLGLVAMVAAPFVPSRRFCRDCRGRWKPAHPAQNRRRHA